MRPGMSFRTLAVVMTLIVLPALALAQSDEELEQWQRAANPGAAHRELAQQAGSWTYVVTMWHEPGSDPVQLEGIARKTMIMGGR